MGTGEAPLTLLGMALPVFKYADSVFPVIFGVAGLAFAYHAIDCIVPDLFKLVVVPALSLAIVIPINLLLLAPIGAWCGIGLASGIVWLFATLGPAAGFLLGFFMPLIVLFGMHQSTSPIQISNIATLGYDYLLPVSFCHNLAESGASFGAALRMEDEKMKSAAFTCAFSAFMGISEPALFSVQVPNRTPLASAMVANGIGGALTVMLGVKCFGFVMPGITSLPVYMEPSGATWNITAIVISICVTWVISAVLSFALWGRKLGRNADAKEWRNHGGGDCGVRADSPDPSKRRTARPSGGPSLLLWRHKILRTARSGLSHKDTRAGLPIPVDAIGHDIGFLFD